MLCETKTAFKISTDEKKKVKKSMLLEMIR